MNQAHSSSDYARFEAYRGGLRSVSHDNLSGNDLVQGGFSRTSSLADLAYVAMPGLTSRVSHNGSVVSLSHLSDAFLEMPEYESPVFIESKPTYRLILSTFITMISTFMCGYNTGCMNTSAPGIRSAVGIPDTVLTPDGVSVAMPSNDYLWGFVVSIYCLGALVGCNSSTSLADRWGRRTFLLWNTVIFLIGALLEASASLPACFQLGGWLPCFSRISLLIAGRCVCGIACGGTMVVVPVYLGETAPAHLRGSFGTCNQLACALGTLLAQLLGTPSALGSGDGWPLLLAFPAVPALLQLFWQPLLVESPRWYAALGNSQMAEEMLVLLRDRPSVDGELQEELFCLLSTAERQPLSRGSSLHSCRCGDASSASTASLSSASLTAALNGNLSFQNLSDLQLGYAGEAPPTVFHAAVSHPGIRRALFTTCTCMLLQQLCGINNVFNFSTAFLLRARLSADACSAIAIAMNVANVVVTLTSVALMDRVGRRPLLLLSFCVMAAASALLSYCIDRASDEWLTTGCAVSVVLLVSGFGIGLGPVPALLSAELFPAAHRVSGSAVAWTTMWMANFVTTQLFLLQVNWLGPSNMFVPHTAVLLTGILVAFCNVPETRGKSLEQIEREMAQRD